VESVDVLTSTGHSELDQSSIAAFLKWRFRPGTVKQAKIPVTFQCEGYRIKHHVIFFRK
jgi:TonB family protein